MIYRTGFVTFAAIAALAATAASAQEYEMKIGVSTPEGYSYNVALASFKEQVEAGSDGAIKVTVFPSSQMGDEAEMGRSVQLGTLEGTVISTSNISPFHTPLQVLSVPYLLKSIECAMTVTSSEVGQEMIDAMREKADIRILGYYTYGYRQLFNTKRPINSVADVAGLKIRIPPDQYMEKTWQAMDASPIPLPFSELFPALQQGVVDGDANPISSIQQFKWYEVVDHVAYTNVAVGMAVFAVNGNFMDSLPEEYQQLVREAAQESVSVNIEADAKSTEAAVEFLEGEGVQFTRPDLDEFREATQPVLDAAAEEFGQEMIDRIVAAQNDC
jgi:TRAP-type transport system periplasmic protein